MAAKKNERYPLRIQGYGSAGEGVARLEGQAVFVKGALRGELCQVHLLKWAKPLPGERWTRCWSPPLAAKCPTAPGTPSAGGASCGT